MLPIGALVKERISSSRAAYCRNVAPFFLIATCCCYLMFDIASTAAIKPGQSFAMTVAIMAMLVATARAVYHLINIKNEPASVWLLGHLKMLNATQPGAINAGALAEIEKSVDISITQAMYIEILWWTSGDVKA